MISEARRQSNNTRYDANSGVPQATFVQYFQNAQDDLEKEAKSSKGKYFRKYTAPFAVVPNQELYSYPDDIYMQSIDTIEWAQDNINFLPLFLQYPKDRLSNQNGWAYGYIPNHNGYLLTPTLASGFLRVTYIFSLPRVQIRQGQISAVTQLGDVVSAITVNIASTGFDATAINEQNYLCVVDRDGNQNAINIEYDSINSGTGVLTLTAPHTLSSGETISVGDYICVGTNTINKPLWPDVIESYLIKYAVYQAKLGDSSNWTKAVQDDVRRMIISCVDSLAMPNDDIQQVSITNTNYLDL